MSSTKSLSVLQLYQEKFQHNEQQKTLQESLIYLKLRELGCPKSKALIFTKKKAKAIDGTTTKDGPAGFRHLKPEKPFGVLNHGWLKGQKLSYHGLRGYSQQIKRNVSKQKKAITAYNQLDRKQMQNIRIKQKKSREGFLRTDQKKILLEQVSNLKDQFLKDGQKRNLFLSYKGMRLEQYTKQYFDTVEDADFNSLVLKLAAFDDPINDQNVQLQTDWQVAKGRSLSSYEQEGEQKRKNILDFRKTFSELQLPKMQGQSQKFRKTLSNSQKKLWISTKKNQSISKQKHQSSIKQFEEFNNKIQKLLWLKSRSHP